MGKTSEKCYRRNKGYKCISFDLFDTLIFRACATPENVFELIIRKYNKKYGCEDLYDFVSKRISAERFAREKSNKEIKLIDIYDILSSDYGNKAYELMEIEEEVEIDMCLPNVEMVDILNQYYNEGFLILIISDMYFDGKVIKRILDKCEIINYKKLYISSEVGLTKRSGELFKFVISEQSIKNSELLHIGDNYISDYIIPSSINIDAVLYKNKSKRSSFIKKTDNSIENSIISNMLMHYSNSELTFSIGYKVLGSLLFGYSYWLNYETELINADKILFLSREGKVMMEYYNILFPNDYRGSYIHVSRKSLVRAAIYTTNSYEELMKLCASLMRGVIYIKEFIDIIGITDCLEEICNDCKICADDCIDDVNMDIVYLSIMKKGKNYFKSQFEMVKAYLSQYGIKGKRVVVADIGWSGTMQLMMEKIYREASFYGRYLALSDAHMEKEYMGLDRKGYYFDISNWKEEGQCIRFTQSAMEILFLSNEGTTLDYAFCGDSVKIIFDDCAIGDEMIYKTSILHAAACKFAQDVKNIRLIEYLQAESCMRICFEQYKRFACYPNKKTIEFYRTYNFVDGIIESKIVPNHKLYHYILKPKDVLNELERNTSKIIWLKGLLRIPFPYLWLLKFLTNKCGMESTYRKSHMNGNQC